MIRKFNYTDRVRILRSDVKVHINSDGGQLAFDVDLSAIANPKYQLPPNGTVFIEAYRQTTWMRFDFGHVGAITPAVNRSLAQFDSPIGIKFRLKVTATGASHKILAEADAIPLSERDESQRRPDELLPVKPQRLGDEIYRLDFSSLDGGRPLLLINSEAGHYSQIGRSSSFISLVYPSVFREILVRILIVDQYEADETNTDWKSQWLRFALGLPGLGELPESEDPEGQSEWICRAVTAFSKKIRCKEKFLEYWEGGK